jgi:peptidoglycan-N-acetylglucosamine deacetylase
MTPVITHATRRRLPVLLVAAASLSVGLLAAAASVASTATAPATQPQPEQPQPQTPARPGAPASGKPKTLAIRYRIVGCRSSGAGAYLHGPPRKEVAIGFDDGPAPDTAAFVRMLEREHARATFFVIGEHVSASYRATLLRELRDGDAIGDHTFTHPDLVTSGGASAQLSETLHAIRTLTGYTPCVFRPPYGAYDRSVLDTARALGLATVLWNVDPTDWALPGTAAIEARVLAQVRPGSIIISHDGGGPRAETLAAYPSIIDKLRARGYRIVTIPQLLGFRPLYVPCVRLCEGIGITHRQLPRDAILQRAVGDPLARHAVLGAAGDTTPSPGAAAYAG